jgi:hypothetical protein
LNERYDITRRLIGALLCFGLTTVLSGCRHKPQAAAVPQVLTPVEIADIPEPEKLPMVDAPQIKLPPVPYATNVKPKHERKKPAPKVPTPEPPVQVAAAPPPPTPEETAIGALTAGGEANPQTKQEAADLIASIEKRLNALSAQKAEDQKAQVSKVKNFLKDAEDAFKTGDAETPRGRRRWRRRRSCCWMIWRSRKSAKINNDKPAELRALYSCVWRCCASSEMQGFFPFDCTQGQNDNSFVYRWTWS